MVIFRRTLRALRKRYSWPVLPTKSVPIERNADGTIRHHPVFESFPPFSGSIPLSFDIDYIGARTRFEFLPYEPHRSVAAVTMTLPGFDEEYFEWIDLLTSIDNAGSHYTFLELGAGFGRWSARAALAARRKGVNFTLGLAEAEPKHVQWISQHMADNDISMDQVHIHPVAVSDENGTALFQISGTQDIDERTARTWYGQRLTPTHDQQPTATRQAYHNYPLLSLPSGQKAIEVQKQDIRTLLDHYDMIDMLDLDVQGEEARIIEAGIERFNTHVKRLHIGTHGRDIESAVRKTLRQHGWQLIYDYPCFSTTNTPYGRIRFTDGVQSWINPRI